MAKLGLSEESERIIKLGDTAVRNLNKDRNWSYWVQAGWALMEIQKVAMERSLTNRPYGKLYTQHFGRIISHFKHLDSLHKSDRSKLIDVMQNFAAVTAYREGLPPELKRRYNHPTTVYRHWRAWEAEQERARSGTAVAAETQTPAAGAGLLSAKSLLEQQVADDSSPKDVAREIIGRFGLTRALAIAEEIMKLAPVWGQDELADGAGELAKLAFPRDGDD